MRSFPSWLLPTIAAVLTVFAITQRGWAGDDFGPIDSVRDQAMERYHDDDFAGFAARMEAVAGATRDDTDLYNLACGYALTGEPQKALTLLQGLVARGASFDVAHDSDLASLHGYPEFPEIVALSAYLDEVNDRLEPIRDQAMEEYSEGRYELFVHIMERLAGYSRNDVDIYNLACGYALMGRPDEAIAQLEILAERGVDYGAASDEDFRSLHGDPRFRALLPRLARAER